MGTDDVISYFLRKSNNKQLNISPSIHFPRSHTSKINHLKVFLRYFWNYSPTWKITWRNLKVTRHRHSNTCERSVCGYACPVFWPGSDISKVGLLVIVINYLFASCSFNSENVDDCHGQPSIKITNERSINNRQSQQIMKSWYFSIFNL